MAERTRVEAVIGEHGGLQDVPGQRHEWHRERPSDPRLHAGDAAHVAPQDDASQARQSRSDREVGAPDEDDASVRRGELTDPSDERLEGLGDRCGRHAPHGIVRTDAEEHDVRTGRRIDLLLEDGGRGRTVARDTAQSRRATVAQLQRSCDAAAGGLLRVGQSEARARRVPEDDDGPCRCGSIEIQIENEGRRSSGPVTHPPHAQGRDRRRDGEDHPGRTHQRRERTRTRAGHSVVLGPFLAPLLGPHVVLLVSACQYRAWLALRPKMLLRHRSVTMATDRTTKGLTAAEKAAVRDRAREVAKQQRGGKRDRRAEGLAYVLAAIASMPEPDRTIVTRLHELVTATAPDLEPRTWYGMPAYARDGKVLCFVQGAAKFETRYTTLGFNDTAGLDDGAMWPTSFAVVRMTRAVETQVRALVRRAVG
jgi:uncharacterized protein YdhG (YjbR/CyaY superfamily)